MSSTIDEKVVELRFDNKQFESGVKESLATLERLKDATNKNISSKSFEGITKAANSIDLSGITKGIDSLQSRFSTLGIVGMRVIENITDGLMGGMSKAIHSVTDSIVSGGIKRAMNIENAHFQLQGLIHDEEEVQAVMEQANESVDGTAYSYDVAAKAASMFAASGLKSGQQMKNALKGIAGTAATANADYERVSELFTTIAGKGRIMAIELNRFASMGMNASAALTNYMNNVNSGAVEASEAVTDAIKDITNGMEITESDLRDLVSDGVVSFEIFSEAMATTFGDHAKDANQTFTGAMANIRAALARTGALFISPLIKQNGPFVEFFNAIRIKVNEFNKALGAANGLAGRFTNWVNSIVSSLTPMIENFKIANIYTRKFADGTEKVFEDAHRRVQKWGDGTQTIVEDDIYTPFHAFADLVQTVVYTLQGLKSIIMPIGEAFADAFAFDVNDLYKGIESLKQMASHFKLSQESADNLYDAFRGVFDIIRTGISLVVRLVSSFLPFQDQVADVGSSFLEIIGYIGRGLSEFSNWINESETLSDIFDTIKVNMLWLYEAISEVVGFLSEGINSLDFSFLDDIFTSIGELPSPIEAIRNALDGLWDILTSVGESFDKYFGDSTRQMLTNLSNLWTKFKDAIVESAKELGPIETFFKILDGTLLTGIFLKVSNISKLLNTDPDRGLGFIGRIEKAITKISSGISKVSSKLAESLNSLAHLIDAKALKEAATAVAILTGALWVLASLNIDDLAKGVAAISVLFNEMVGSLVVLNNLASSVDVLGGFVGILDAIKIGALATSLIKLAAAVLILSFAVKNLGSMNLLDLAKGLGAVTLLLMEMIGAMAVMNEIGPEKFTSVGLGVLLLSAAIAILGKAVKSLSEIDTEGLIKGLLSVMGLLVGIGIFAKMSGDAKNMFEIGISMMLIAGAIKLISNSLTDLASLRSDALIQGLGAIAGILIALAVFTAETGGAQNMFEIGVAMIALSFAIKQIGEAIQGLSTVSDTGILNGLLGIAGVMFTLAAVVKQMTNMTGSKATGAAGIAMMISMAWMLNNQLVPALTSLSKIPWKSMAKTIVAITAVMAIIGETMACVTGITDQYGKWTTAKSLAIFSGFVALLKYPISETLQDLSKIPWKGMATAVLGMGATLFILVKVMEKVSSMNASKSMEGLVALAIAIQAVKPIAKILTELGTMRWDQAVVGVLAFASAVAIMMTALFSLTKMTNMENILVGVIALFIAVRAIKPLGDILVQLGSMSWEQAIIGIVAFGVVLAELIGAMYLAGLKADTGIPIIGAMLIALLVNTIQPIVPLMQALANLGWEGMKTSLAAMGGAFGILVLAMNLAGIAAFGGVTAAIPALGALLLAFIINTIHPIVPLMQGLAEISWDGVKNACLGLAGALLVLIIAMYIAGATSVVGYAGAGSIAAIARAVAPIPGIMQQLSTIPWESMKTACKNLTISIISLVIASLVMSAIGPLATSAAAGLYIFGNVISAAIGPLVQTITQLVEAIDSIGEINEEQFSKSLDIVGKTLKAFGSALKEYQITAGLKSGALVDVAEAIAIMAPHLASLGNLDADKIKDTLEKIGEAMGTFGQALKSYNFITSGFKADALKTIAEAISTMAPAIRNMATLRMDKFKTVMTTLGTAFNDFGTALNNTPWLLPGTRAEGIGALCENITTLTEVLPGFIQIAGGEGGRYAKQALTILGDTFKEFGTALDGSPWLFADERAEGIGALCNNITTLTEVLPELIKVTAGEGGRYVSQGLGTISKTFADFSDTLNGTIWLGVEGKANAIATLINNISNLGNGIRDFITTTSSFGEDKLSSALTTISTALVTFGLDLNAAPLFNADDRGEGIAAIAGSLSDMATGIKDFIEIESDAETMKETMSIIGSGLESFGTAIQKAGIINAEGRAQALIDVVNNLPLLADVVERFTGLTGADTQMEAIGSGIEKIGAGIKNAGIFNTDGKAQAIISVVESFQSLADGVTAFKEAMGNGNVPVIIGQMVGVIQSVAAALKEFSSDVSLNVETFGQFVEALATLSGVDTEGLTNGLNSLIKVKDTLKSLGSEENTASLNSFNTALKKVATEGIAKFVAAFGTELPTATDAITQFLTAIIEVMDAYTERFSDMGKKHGEAYIQGLQSCYEKAYTVGKMLGMKAYSGLELQIKNFEQIGTMCAKGFANGLVNSEALQAIAKSAAKIGEEAKRATKASVDSDSPSKDFMKIGAFCGEGMAIGLYEWSDRVATAAGSLGESAKTGLQLALENLNKQADDILDGTPVITPMVDLTNVISAADQVNSMFNSALFRTNSGTRGIANVMAGRVMQNGSEEFQNGQGKFGNTYNFIQNNRSPKALSRVEIYRDTKSLLKQYREAVEGV